MFYDERIEKERGKISKNAIVMSALISALIFALRVAVILKNSDNPVYLIHLIPEGAVILVGIVVFALGLFRYSSTPKDEYITEKESIFYGRALVLEVKILSLIFAASLPIALYIGNSEFYIQGKFGNIFSVLVLSVGIYVIFSFRKHNIYFNYSIMDREDYISCVFKNIGRLALWFLLLFGVSFASLIFWSVPVRESAALPANIFLILIYYLLLFVFLSLLYLLFSLLEKSSNNTNHFISKSALITLAVSILIYAVYAFLTVVTEANSESEAQAVTLVSALSILKVYVNVAYIMFLSYFGYEFLRQRQSKLFSLGVFIAALSQVVLNIGKEISIHIRDYFISEIMEGDIYFVTMTSDIKLALQIICLLFSFLGLSMVLTALIRQKEIHKLNFIGIVCFVLLMGVEAFLSTQTDYLKVLIYHACAEIAVLTYLFVIVSFIGRKKTEEDEFLLP